MTDVILHPFMVLSGCLFVVALLVYFANARPRR